MALKKLTTLVSLLLLAATYQSCTSSDKLVEKEVSGFDLANLDTTTNAKDNFYDWAVGGWTKSNSIPDDQVRWGAFTILREETNDQVKTIVEEAVGKAKNGANSLAGQVGTFYSVGMDTVKIEKLGLSPLENELARISALSTKKELIKEIAHMHKYTSAPLFFFYSTTDAKNSDSVIAGMWQGGLGLPDRDYYVKDDTRSKEIRVEYLSHLKNMLTLMKDNDPEQSTNIIMEIETRLAKASNTMLENRDPNATYNKFTTEKIISTIPGFDWKLYFSEIEIGDPLFVDISQPKFITEVGKMISEVPLDNWKTYLKWNLVRSMSPYLNSAFVNERFAFTGKFLNGQKEMRPRWKRVQGTTSGALGEAIGQLYVEKYFPPEAKARAKKIVESLIVSMGESISSLEWMSEETKVEAQKKLSGFGVKIGYPDKWRDYSELEITNDSYVQNVMNSNYFDHKETLSKINKPVRDWEWGMSPQTVNAYYNPTRNEIVFPAAILQSPFYNVNVDDAINYGGMGCVIGHEITHGFDDQGRQYDADGNIRDWWTKADSDRFDKRAKRIIDQFNAFEPLDSFYVDGELTQGENIADLGGLTVSYNAFKNTEQFKNGESIDGFTPTQRFYLNWAQVWKNNIRDEALKLRLKTDVHSPGKYRVLGPLSNIPEFYEAFGIAKGDGMYRDEDVRVQIW
ncbi:MAG: M13 family metallopeptidase [Ignavibacteriae bacterium]|nr:M13 family metallopeptidase [Ignavibacteriota bacterium]